MDGGGTSESFVLGDIGDYKQMSDIPPIVAASLVGVNLAALLNKFAGLGGPSLNAFFDTLGLEGVIANISYTTIIFQITRWFYTNFYVSGGRPWSPIVFVCSLISLDFLHSIMIYYGPLNTIPSGKNDIIDILKKYASENGSRALAGQAVGLIFIAAIAMIFKESSIIFMFLIMILTLYMLPFLLTTAGPRPPPPPVQEKKEPEWNIPRR